MIKASVARKVGAIIHKTRQTALQADGLTPLTVVREVHFNVNRDHVDLHLDALAVEAPTSCIMALKALPLHRTMYCAPSPMSYVLHHNLQSFGQESI